MLQSGIEHMEGSLLLTVISLLIAAQKQDHIVYDCSRNDSDCTVYNGEQWHPGHTPHL